MNDEIKEILIKEFCTDWKEKRLYIELLVNSTPFSNLLDYITNLQREKDSLDDYNRHLHNELKDYKSRNEKAIDKLNTQLAFTSSYQLNYQSAMNIIEETKSILQGSDKE